MNTSPQSLTAYAWLSLGAAVATIGLKTYAWWLTDSMGLLSDALESLINLVAAIIMLAVLGISSQPPDDDHAYGHEKIEYFSSGAEGIMIMLAAFSIALTAWERLWHPMPLQALDIGIAVSIVASMINLVVAQILIRVGKQRHSITLEADGKHLMTDVWTTAGILLGISLIALADRFPASLELAQSLGLENWSILDPLIALLVAVHIIWAGIHLLQRTASGLLDAALPADEQTQIIEVLESFVHDQPITYHALRTRYAGARRFVSVHILVPGNWTVQQGHDLVERIELELMNLFDYLDIDTHLEPIEDEASWRH